MYIIFIEPLCVKRVVSMNPTFAFISTRSTANDDKVNRRSVVHDEKKKVAFPRYASA